MDPYKEENIFVFQATLIKMHYQQRPVRPFPDRLSFNYPWREKGGECTHLILPHDLFFAFCFYFVFSMWDSVLSHCMRYP